MFPDVVNKRTHGVILSKLLNLVRPQLLYLQKRNNDNTYIIRHFGKISEIK